MDGVTVLTETNIVNMSLPLLIVALAFIAIIGAMLLYSVFQLFDTCSRIIVIVALLIIATLLCAIVGVIIHAYLTQVPETQYEVTIDDSVSFNDFMEHYEIIAYHDDSYTVKERNGE